MTSLRSAQRPLAGFVDEEPLEVTETRIYGSDKLTRYTKDRSWIELITQAGTLTVWDYSRCFRSDRDALAWLKDEVEPELQRRERAKPRMTECAIPGCPTRFLSSSDETLCRSCRSPIS